MEYTLLTNTFGGMNLRKDPAAIGPGMAQDNQGVDVTTGVAVNDQQVLFSFPAYSVSSSGSFGTSQVYSTTDSTAARYDFGMSFTYHAYGDRVMRIPRYTTTSGWVPQYSTSASPPTWQALGIKLPVLGSFAAASGGAGGLTGDYLFVVVFYNAFGDESPPTASISFTAAANDVDLSNIPIGYGQGTTTNGSTSITGVVNPSYFRVGMRITAPSGIPAGTYITAISGTTITISQAATASGAVELQDAQVTGRRIYRTTAGGTTYYRAIDLGNVTSTTYAGHNTSDATLITQSLLSTETDDDVLPSCYGGTISPDGILMAVESVTASQNVVFTKNDASFLSKADYTLDVGVNLSQVAFALSRFVVFSRAEVFFILGDDPATLDLIKTSSTAPVYNGATYYGGANPVEMPDGSLWFTSTLGVCRFDGSTVEVVTRDVFTDVQNASIGNNTLAAVNHQGHYFLLTSLDSRTSYRGILFDTAIPGWRYLTPGDSGSGATTGAAWVNNWTSPPELYYYKDTVQCRTLASSGTGTNGVYWTGEWSGERRSSLKKFRRVSVMHNGRVKVDTYVDGTAVGSQQDFTRTTLGRSVFWLPSGTRGRVASVKLTLVNTAAEVHEVGVWVGEERGPMP